MTSKKNLGLVFLVSTILMTRLLPAGVIQKSDLNKPDPKLYIGEIVPGADLVKEIRVRAPGFDPKSICIHMFRERDPERNYQPSERNGTLKIYDRKDCGTQIPLLDVKPRFTLQIRDSQILGFRRYLGELNNPIFIGYPKPLELSELCTGKSSEQCLLVMNGNKICDIWTKTDPKHTQLACE